MDAVNLVEHKVVPSKARLFFVELLAERVEGTLEVLVANFAVGVDTHAASPNVEVTLAAEGEDVVEAANGLKYIHWAFFFLFELYRCRVLHLQHS